MGEIVFEHVHSELCRRVKDINALYVALCQKTKISKLITLIVKAELCVRACLCVCECLLPLQAKLQPQFD